MARMPRTKLLNKLKQQATSISEKQIKNIEPVSTIVPKNISSSVEQVRSEMAAKNQRAIDKSIARHNRKIEKQKFRVPKLKSLPDPPSLNLNTDIPKFKPTKRPSITSISNALTASQQVASANAEAAASIPEADIKLPNALTASQQVNGTSNVSVGQTQASSTTASSVSQPHTGTVGEQSTSSSNASTASTDQSNKRSLKKTPEGFKGKRAELTYDQQLNDAKSKINGSKSEEYHIGRVEENRKNARNDINNIDENDIDKMKQYAQDKGYTVSGPMTRDKLLEAVDNHAKERLKAGADWTDTMMAHHVPQYAVALGTTATLAANVLSSNGHKSNTELYSSPY